MSKKLTQWERNRINIENAQRRAQVLISQLESQGAEVRSDLKKLATRDLTKNEKGEIIKKRFTKKEAKAIMGLLQSSRIKAAARQSIITKSNKLKTSIQMPNLSLHKDITNVARPHENVSVRIGHEVEDRAAQLLKSYKYALRYRPSKSIGKSVNEMLKLLGYKVKVGKEYEFLKKIDKNIFIQKFEDVYSKNRADLEHFSSTFYGQGKSSPEIFKYTKIIWHESAKKTFGMNHKLSASQIESLYEFFDNSTTWSHFRKTYHDSEQENYEDEFIAISSLLNAGFTQSSIDKFILRHPNDFVQRIEKILQRIEKNN